MPANYRFRMKGDDVYDRLGNRVGRISGGTTVLDATNRRLGFVEGDTVFEAGSRRRLAFLRDGQVYDANNNRLGPLVEVLTPLAGAPQDAGGLALVALLARGGD